MREIDIYCLSNTNKITPKQALVPALWSQSPHLLSNPERIQPSKQELLNVSWSSQRAKESGNSTQEWDSSCKRCFGALSASCKYSFTPLLRMQNENQTHGKIVPSKASGIGFFSFWTPPFTWGRSREHQIKTTASPDKDAKESEKNVLACFSGIFCLDYFSVFLIHRDSFRTSQLSCLSYWPCSYCWKPVLGLCSCQDWCSPWGYPSEHCVLCEHRQELERDYAWHHFWTTHHLWLPRDPSNHPGNLIK